VIADRLPGLTFALCLTGLAGWAIIALRGRIPASAYHTYLQSPEWAHVRDRFRALGRARRCAACHTWQALHTHHWTYRNLGREFLWQLVALCGPCHSRVGSWSEWLCGNRNGWLWLTTPAVIAHGTLLRRLGYGPGGIRPGPRQGRGRLEPASDQARTRRPNHPDRRAGTRAEASQQREDGVTGRNA
jgi:hypothetical protein